MRHPDENSSGFNPAHGWCAQCGCTLRVSGTKWYGSNSTGPFCSTECLRKANKQGELPDYVREFRADGRPIDEQLDEARARDFRLPQGSLYPDEARAAFDVTTREAQPKVIPGSGGAW